MTSRRPPRLADALLTRRLSPDERDELIGDLHEQFAARAAVSVGRARRWYWRQALALSWGFALRQRDVVSRGHERTRGAWFAGQLGTDLTFAWRSLQHSRSFAVITLLTLTAGIGLSTALFSFVSGILLQPLPYAHSDRLVRITESRPDGSGPGAGTGVSDTAIGQWIARNTSLDAFAPYSDQGLTVGLPSGPANIDVADVGAEFFVALSTTPMAGRLLAPADAAADAAPSVVISERLWRQEFGGRLDLTGAAATIDQVTHTVVGVVPASFGWPTRDVDMWRIGADFTRAWPPPGARRNFFMSADVVARLKPGATIVDALRDGRDIALAIATADPAFADGAVEPNRMIVRPLVDDVVAPVTSALLTLSAGMTLALFALCVNLANLLLTRHTARQREFAVRVALGASRWRVARPVLFEVLLLGVGGGAGGALLAWWLVRALPALAPQDLPRLETLQFDARSFRFAVTASLLTALVVGLVPVWRAPLEETRASISSARIQVGRRSRSADRLRASLVTAQIAVATVLLVGAALLGRTVWALVHVPMGFKPARVVTFQVSTPRDIYRQAGRQSRFYNEITARLSALPGVEAAAFAQALPLRGLSSRMSVNVEGRPVTPGPLDFSRMVLRNSVSPGYLDAIGTAVVRGRGLTAGDTLESERVVLIDESLARQYLPGEDPLGLSLRGPGRQSWKIVGITESAKVAGPGRPPQPVIYFPSAQLPDILAYERASGIVVRLAEGAGDMSAAIRDIARQLEPDWPVYNLRPLTAQVAETMAAPRFYAVGLGLFAAMALITAVLGIYGALAYSVERRTREFGVRRALGAREGDVLAVVARQGLWLTVVGLAVGLTSAALIARGMSSVLFGVRPVDPVSLAGASLLIFFVVIAASWQPARRALRVDPARALRNE
jgi:predicted permease